MSCPKPQTNTCPMNHDPRNMMDIDLDLAKENIHALSSDRISSSIPKADVGSENSTWLYPSPQMFYNAIRRKGQAVRPEDMEVIVAIHNMVNEQTWQSIIRWEKYYHPEGGIKLRRFLGRPTDMSPKAWIKTHFLGYTKPFDRHDWYVERNGEEIRYVIDFYSGRISDDDPAKAAPSFYIDARPALDSLPAIYERLHFATYKLIDVVKRWLKPNQ